MIDKRDQPNQLKRSSSYVEDDSAVPQLSRAFKKPGDYPHGTSIVFFGSGPVAAKSLELLAETFTIEAVITKPKPLHHRGEFPVILAAEKRGLALRTVTNRAELSELIAAKPFASRLAILIDFGIIVAQDVIDYFELGVVNSHFSLLPQWRGADPITFSILSGQSKTGVSLMLIDSGMDTGKLLAQKGLAIRPDATTAQLTDELIKLSDLLLQQYLPQYIAGSLKAHNQPHPDRATYSRKLTKDDGLIDWAKPAQDLEREIRAFIDWPKSRVILGGKDVIITQAQVVEGHGSPGKALEHKARLVVATGDGALEILKLKPAGKPEMTAQAFLAGRPNLA